MPTKRQPTVRTIFLSMKWDDLSFQIQEEINKEFGKDWPKKTGNWTKYEDLKTGRKYWTQDAASRFPNIF